jgi:hypothetical protein
MVLATETLANKAVQAELDSVVGRSRLPTFNDQKDLPLLNAFIKEVHRFRPVSSSGFIALQRISPTAIELYLQDQVSLGIIGQSREIL